MSIRPLVLTVFILFMVQPGLSHANGGPVFNPADGRGLLQLDENSHIRLVREKVTFYIPQIAHRFRDEAEISVQYELTNGNQKEKTTDIVFLTPSIEDLSVQEGAVPVDTIPAADAIPVNWRRERKDTVTDPVSGQALALSRSYDEQAAGTRFRLTFAPQETKRILIRYRESGGMYDRGVINTIFSHLYYLTPAKFWQGEPQVELEVRFDRPGSRLHSNLKLQQLDGVTYQAKFDRLPDTEWYFSYVYPKRLLFPTNIERDHNLWVLALAVLLTGIAAAATLFMRNNLIFIFSSVGIWVLTWFFITKMGGYPFNAIFVGMTDFAVAAMLFVCFMFVRKRNLKK